jgi:hypothetical protein
VTAPRYFYDPERKTLDEKRKQEKIWKKVENPGKKVA